MIIMTTTAKKTKTSTATTKTQQKLRAHYIFLISCLSNHWLNFQMSSHIPSLFSCTITVLFTTSMVNVQFCIILKIELNCSL